MAETFFDDIFLYPNFFFTPLPLFFQIFDDFLLPQFFFQAFFDGFFYPYIFFNFLHEFFYRLFQMDGDEREGASGTIICRASAQVGTS